LARLTKSVYLKKSNGIAGGLRIQDNRLDLAYAAPTGGPPVANGVVGYIYRGNKWFTPWGSDLMQLYTKVNGITYPLSNNDVMIDEFLLKE
jgi:hypothetical protein